MSPVALLTMIGIMLSPVYAALYYLINQERKNAKKISGIVEILDDEFEDVDIQKIPHVEG